MLKKIIKIKIKFLQKVKYDLHFHKKVRDWHVYNEKKYPTL